MYAIKFLTLVLIFLVVILPSMVIGTVFLFIRIPWEIAGEYRDSLQSIVEWARLKRE